MRFHRLRPDLVSSATFTISHIRNSFKIRVMLSRGLMLKLLPLVGLSNDRNNTNNKAITKYKQAIYPIFIRLDTLIQMTTLTCG